MMSPRTLLRLIALSVLPLAALPTSAPAAPVRKGKATATVRRPAAANGIIALPLVLTVPAAQRACAMRTPSGLGYTMLRPSAGPKPGAGDTALVDYIGYLAATGAVFDQGQRSALGVDGVIPGFSEGLRMLGKGGVARLCIPAALGYGAQATGPIPANADLVFQVGLIDYRAAAADGGPAAAGQDAVPR